MNLRAARRGLSAVLYWTPVFGLLILAGLDVWLLPDDTFSVFAGPRWLESILQAATILPLALRRRHPLGSMVVVNAAAAVYFDALYLHGEQGPIEPFIACVVADYACALRCSRERAAIGGAFAAVATLAGGVPSMVSGSHSATSYPPG